ncbi:SirB2 family protein [Pseudoalteromonas arctica]|uniref:SirB2 family protein n=1 Tax=Pseudoalteromonas arctica TaxID=394751 RepID=A0A7Y0DSQ1_9GAMM|nr:SirB2 family protein [Pseudoalteromonas arctica]NMM40758.1 SirB2 family protein [Pseudoalteromonas arctica]
MDYLAVKHTHMAIAVLSIVLFYVRSFSRLGSGAIVKNKLVFIGSHATDTFLLISAITLMAIAKINPLEQTWLLEKIILVVAYIALGIIASKQQKTSIKVVFLVVTTGVIALIGKLAVTKAAFVL